MRPTDTRRASRNASLACGLRRDSDVKSEAVRKFGTRPTVETSGSEPSTPRDDNGARLLEGPIGTVRNELLREAGCRTAFSKLAVPVLTTSAAGFRLRWFVLPILGGLHACSGPEATSPSVGAGDLVGNLRAQDPTVEVAQVFQSEIPGLYGVELAGATSSTGRRTGNTLSRATSMRWAGAWRI